MKKIALFLLLASAFAQAGDVRVQGSAVFTVLARNASWGAINPSLTYVYDSVSANTGECILIHNNNPTNTRSVTIGTAYTGDPAVTVFTGNSTSWIAGSNTGTTLSAPGTFTVFFPAFGSAHMAVGLSGESGTAGGTPDTYDLIAIQSSSCTNQGSNNSGAPQFPTTIIASNQWSIVSAPATGVKATVANAASPNISHTAVCISASLAATAATACGPAGTDVVIRDGACGSGTIKWQQILSTPATIGSRTSIDLCGLQIEGTSGNAMCVEFGTLAASCIERVNLSGFDQ